MKPYIGVVDHGDYYVVSIDLSASYGVSKRAFAHTRADLATLIAEELADQIRDASHEAQRQLQAQLAQIAGEHVGKSL